VDRRESRRCEVRRRLRQRQPGHRGGDRSGRRRSSRGHGVRHRGSPARLRRDLLVHRPRLPASLPRAVPAGPREGEGAPAAPDRAGGGRADPAHLRGAGRLGDPGPLLGDRADRVLRLGTRAARARVLRHAQPQARLQGGHGGGGLHHALELPAAGEPGQGGAGPRRWEHDRAQAGARHALECHVPGPGRRGAHRHPARRLQRRHVRGRCARRRRPPSSSGASRPTWCWTTPTSPPCCPSAA
jgi:hypothetical protein